MAKYEQLDKLPSRLKAPRRYRTRADAFAEEWPQLEQMLRDAPELEATALFAWLQEQQPGRYQDRQLRTFQRRVAQWRALNQPQLATLAQVHEPGELLELDGTWLTELDVTLQGQPFKHMFIHCVLPYSNWEWGRIVQSESLGAVRLGLQSALVKLGHVPRRIQTDNSSAVTVRFGIRAEQPAAKHLPFTHDYLQLLAHYGLEPQTTHSESPNENGDVEAANGALKRALKQELLLRGSRDFADTADYEAFLFAVLDKRNRQRQERLAAELAVMKPLTATPLANSTKLTVRVSSGSLIRVRNKSYSVPTSLIGKQVTVYVHEWSLEVYYAGQLVDTLPRLIGQRLHHINYRHLVDTLLRKPGGFRRYRFREDLFPQLVFRQAWEQLNQWHSPRRADIIYLRILRLAAHTLESDVAAALQRLVHQGRRWSEADVHQLVAPEPVVVPQVQRAPVELDVYDQLLVEFAHELA